MTWRLRIVLLLLVLIAVPLIMAPVPQNPTPPPDPNGGGCPYCSQSACGCDAYPPCVTHGLCGCSSIDCWRTCTYTCP